MSIAVKLSDELVRLARVHGAASNRSTPGMIEYWAKIGRIAEENPDLPVPFIKDILLGLQEAEAGMLKDHVFGTENQEHDPDDGFSLKA